MPEVRFYHLQRQSLAEALPKLVEKAYGTGAKIVIKMPKTLLPELDRALWCYDPNSFIPHGSNLKTGEAQPVYLTTEDANPAGATIQILLNAIDSDTTDSFSLCLYMFDGRDADIVTKARTAWKQFSEKDYSLSYWQQKETGGWEQKV